MAFMSPMLRLCSPRCGQLARDTSAQEGTSTMSHAETLSTGQAIARSLIRNGVDTNFGIPGAHTYDFIDALHECRDKIRFIVNRHEQGSGYMAYGYAKSTGRVGAFTCVPGPGVLNAGAALCTAYGAKALVDLEVPMDVTPPPAPDPDVIARAVALLQKARNPMITVGGGAIDAGAHVLELAKLLQAPVTSHRSGRGIVGEDTPYGFPCGAGYRPWLATV